MKLFFTPVFLFTVLLASAQNTFKTRYLPQNLFGQQTHLTQLGDGSFVAVEALYYGSGASGYGNIYLVKTNASGLVTASKTIATDGFDYAYSIAKTSDGGFAIAGQMNDNMGLLKFKADLTLEWQREYQSASGFSGALKVIQATDGGYMLAGSVTDANDDYAGSVIKTDAQGAIQFQKRYFDYDDSYVFDVSPMTDGNYAILLVDENEEYYIGKIAANGNLLWTRQLTDNTGLDIFLESVTGSSDGGLVVAGTLETFTDYFGVMAKYGSDGSLQWSERITSATNSGSYFYNVLQDADGGYVFSGYGYSNTNLSEYGYAVKTNAAGALVWTKKVDETNDGTYTEFRQLVTTADGAYAAGGLGDYYQDGNYGYGPFIFKFNSSFDICSDAPGSDGALGSLGTSQTATLTATNISLTSSAPAVTVSDISTATYYECSTLPLQLLSFNAVVQNKSVGISWKTANEINTDHFVVERSANGVAFTALQTVAAKGSSSVTQSYGVSDLQPLPGTSYYRLRQVDRDGKTTYSSIAQVTVTGSGTIVISPNPVQDAIKVIVQSNANRNLTLQVVDMRGNVLATQTRAVGAGRNEISIPAASLAKGIYVLKVTDDKSAQAIRFVKE